MNRNEIELKDFLKSAWTRKWLVLGLTAGAVLAALAVNGMFPVITSFESVINTDMPAELKIKIGRFVDNINRTSNDGSLPGKLKMDPRGFPPVSAKLEKDPSLFRLSVQSRDRREARTIIKAVVAFLNARIRDWELKLRPDAERRDYLLIVSEVQNQQPTLGPQEWIIAAAGVFGFLFSTLLAYLLESFKEKRRIQTSRHE